MASWSCVGLIFWGQAKAFISLPQFETATEAFCHGRGSKTLNALLTNKKWQRNKWTERDLLKAAQDMGAGTGPKKTLSWGKAVKKARTSETGG